MEIGRPKRIVTGIPIPRPERIAAPHFEPSAVPAEQPAVKDPEPVLAPVKGEVNYG